jgi:hypothetical protein
MLRIMIAVIGLFLAIALAGCTHIEVGAEGGGGRTYYSPSQQAPGPTHY